jgi:hypothetical protein
MSLSNNYSGIGPERGVEYVFTIGLISQANTKVLQANPTIAAGDFKVSIDHGSLNNPITLPSVSPAGSKLVKVTLSPAEMDGDNIDLICSDAAGDEWCDQIVNIQTSPGGAEAQELAAVDNTAHTPTTTEFESDSITEATADHYKGRAIVWRSGALKGQACSIKAYSLVSGRGHFTVSTLTEAPANDDRFVIV